MNNEEHCILCNGSGGDSLLNALKKLEGTGIRGTGEYDDLIEKIQK